MADSGLTSGKQVCAVLVTYHPDAELPSRVARVLREVGALVIVDNGSGEAALAMLRALAGDPRIEVVPNFLQSRDRPRVEHRDRARGGTSIRVGAAARPRQRIDSDMVATLIEVRAAFPEPGAPGRDRSGIQRREPASGRRSRSGTRRRGFQQTRGKRLNR